MGGDYSSLSERATSQKSWKKNENELEAKGFLAEIWCSERRKASGKQARKRMEWKPWWRGDTKVSLSIAGCPTPTRAGNDFPRKIKNH